MKRVGNIGKKVCFDIITISAARRCSANIPFNFVPQLRPKKEKETPSPLTLSIPENYAAYSDDEKNLKNKEIIHPNRKISKVVKPHYTKSSKQVGFKKIGSCYVTDERRMKFDEDSNDNEASKNMHFNLNLLEEDNNLYIGAKGNINIHPRSRASIFKAIEKKQVNNEDNMKSSLINTNITLLSGLDYNLYAE